MMFLLSDSQWMLLFLVLIVSTNRVTNEHQMMNTWRPTIVSISKNRFKFYRIRSNELSMSNRTFSRRITFHHHYHHHHSTVTYWTNTRSRQRRQTNETILHDSDLIDYFTCSSVGTLIFKSNLISLI